MMRWYNVELNRVEADGLKRILHNNDVKYETSQADAMVHFEIFLKEGGEEYIKINAYLSTN